MAGRLLRFAATKPLLAVVLLVAGVAAAAITVTYTTNSTLSTGVVAPPIQFLPGDDTGALSDYVSTFAISANKTYLTTTVKGVPEATLTVGSFFKLTNIDDESHFVTLSTTNVTNSLVSGYTLQLYDSANTLQSTLNLRAASDPTTAAFALAAGQTYQVKLTLTLASTAGADNVASSNSLSLSFT